MRSGLCYPALFYDDDLFRIPYGAQPVGYHYGCPAFEEGLQVVHDSAFVVGISALVASSKKMNSGPLYTARAMVCVVSVPDLIRALPVLS